MVGVDTHVTLVSAPQNTAMPVMPVAVDAWYNIDVVEDMKHRYLSMDN